MREAVTSWLRASTIAAVTNQTFMWMVSVKKRWKYGFPAPSRWCATNPIVSETRAKATSGTANHGLERGWTIGIR